MYKVTAVCNAGVGSSAFCKGLIQKAAKSLGYKASDFSIDCTEIMGSKGLRVDLIVTQKTLLEKVTKNVQNGGSNTPVVAVASLVSDIEAMAEAIGPYLKKAEEAGKIHKTEA